MKQLNSLKKTLLIYKNLSLTKAPYQVFFYDFLTAEKFSVEKSFKVNKYFFKRAYGNFPVKFPMKLNFYDNLDSLKKSDLLFFFNKILLKSFNLIFLLSFNLFFAFSAVNFFRIFLTVLSFMKSFYLLFQCIFVKNNIK